MTKLWVKTKFYVLRTMIDQLVLAGFFGSRLHLWALVSFTVTLEQAHSCGWLLMPSVAKVLEDIPIPEDSE